MSTSLGAAPLGRRLVITRLDTEPGPTRRLAELGLRPGAPVRCLRRTAGDGRILDIAGARVAVGRDILTLIAAEPDGGDAP